MTTPLSTTTPTQSAPQSLGAELFDLVERDQGYAFVSDAISGLPNEKVFDIARGALKHTEITARKDSTLPKEARRTTMNTTVPSAPETRTGVGLIAAERERQLSQENWTSEHDDHHAGGELAQAAACYAWPAPRPLEVKKAWPWELRDWKPELYGAGAERGEKIEARIRVLTKAGALLAAEIDRLERVK